MNEIKTFEGAVAPTQEGIEALRADVSWRLIDNIHTAIAVGASVFTSADAADTDVSAQKTRR